MFKNTVKERLKNLWKLVRKMVAEYAAALTIPSLLALLLITLATENVIVGITLGCICLLISFFALLLTEPLVKKH